MKILDRYVLASFLKNYLISFMVLIGLYVVLDMVFNFDDFADVGIKGGPEGATPVLLIMRGIVDYYFYKTFQIFVQLSGIIPVVAAAFTLIRLARFNELTASLAAGVPLLRSAMPIIIAAVVLNVLLVVDQELIIPGMIPKLTRERKELSQATSQWYQVAAMQDESNQADEPKGLLNVARYHPPTEHRPAWMEEVDVTLVDKNFMPVAHIRAAKGEWDPRRQEWKLTDGVRVTGLSPDATRGIKEEPWPAYQSSITPDEIALYRSGKYVELLPTSRIKMLLERPKSYGTIDLQRVKHSRFTQPLLNVILLLLAIPCLLAREPGQIKTGILYCGIFCSACLATIFLSHQLAGTPPAGADWADRWPAIMAWLPILIFGPIAVFLLDRVKT